MADIQEKKLNKEQLEAVKHGEGPFLIIAGAGTGKTTVITERIKWLVSSGKAKPAEILALTFTDKAAREMEERVDVAMPYGYTQMWISTFHSFCDRILRQEAVHIGLDPGYKLMNEAETTQFLIKNLFKFDLKYFRPLGNPTKFISGMLQHFSRLKDEDVLPNEYLRFAQSQKSKVKSQKLEVEEVEKTLELAKAYRAYEELKVKEGVMDFGDLISNALKLFRTRKNVLKEYQDQFNYVLVDEFQDTNYAQNQLAMLLAGKKANLTVTGDDDQCLPPDAKVKTLEGEKRIDQLKKGDKILTAVGKGHTSTSVINRIFKQRKKARLITFTTEGGHKITVTDNHKMFCFVPPKPPVKDRCFVYLMKQRKFGWRLGVTNDLAARLRLERQADMILAVGSYKTEQEARFWEAFLAAKYGLPTVPFSARPHQALSGEWLDRLYQEINTREKAERLAQDFRIDLSAPHFMVDAVNRGESRRVKVNLLLCQRNYRGKTHRDGFLANPGVFHAVLLETSDKETIEKLKRNKIPLQKAKKGLRFRFQTTDLIEAGKIAQELVEITDGLLDVKFSLGTLNYQHKPARVMPAANVVVGNYLPVLKGKKVVYERVVDREEKFEELEVYDLEINRTHNFIANGIVVHNSIYRFRGAAVSNIIQFRENYPKAKLVVLTKNYRSTQEILDRAYNLIQNNNPDRLEIKEKIDKKLKAVREIKGKLIEFIHTDRVENEAEAVAKKIASIKYQVSSIKYSDFAILVRANNHAAPFVRALSRAGIPYQFLGPGQLFRQPEVKDLIAYLKILYNFEDNVALFRVLSMEHFEISARDLAAINNFGRRQNLSLFEACEQIEKIFVSQKTKEQIANFITMVHRHLKLLPKETAGQILYYFLEDTGLLKKLTEFKSPIEEKQAQNISSFFDRLKTYEVDHEDASVSAVVDWINLSMELGESPLANNIDWVQENRVNLLTVHSSKGLEFPVIFLVNLVAQRFPTIERREQIPIPERLIKEILPVGDYHLEEEHRLFYVGMTRACDRLFLTAADYYGEGKREKKISPFVVEALGEGAIKQLSNLAIEEKQLPLLEWAKPQEKEEPLATSHTPINYLSYSQIDTFNTCPLQYRYRYIQRIPVPPSSATSFGGSMHKTLRDFYQEIRDGRKLTKTDLMKMLEINWSPVGYASKAHENKRKKQGERMLADFYEKFDARTVPKDLEQPFIIKVSPQLKIGGKIDRIDEKEGKLEIIDYKTGRVLDQNDIDKSLQLTVYALAAADKGIYGRKPDEVILTFYFLETTEKKSTKRTVEQLKQAKRELLEKAKEIEKSSFEPTPSNMCDYCDFKLICEAWQ